MTILGASGRLDERGYETALGDRPEATLFHTRDWARIVVSAFPQLADMSCVFETSNDASALPLYSWRRLGGLLTTIHSSFPFLYGGPVPATKDTWEAFLDKLGRQRGSAVVLGNPFTQSAHHENGAAPDGRHLAGCFAQTSETTHLLTLPQTVDAFWNEVLTTRKRNDIRRLTRKGVQVELSRHDEDIRAVYGLYLKRMKAWDQRPGLIYPLGFYQAMVTLGGEAVRLYVARFEDKVVGGTFVCRFNGIVHYQAGYFDPEMSRLRPNVLIQERIIRDAIEDGMRIYDMLPSAGIAAVESFKESFGGIKTPFPRYEKKGGMHRLSARLRARLKG